MKTFLWILRFRIRQKYVMNSLLDIKTEMQVEKEVPIPRSDPKDGDIIPQKSYPAYCTLCKVSAFPVTR